MEIKERTLLTNVELLDLLERKKVGPLAEFTKVLYNKENLEKTFQVHKYLNENSKGTLESAKILSKELNQFNLFKYEKVQLINLRPINEEELCLIIPNCFERYDESQRKQMLQIIAKVDIS